MISHRPFGPTPVCQGPCELPADHISRILRNELNRDPSLLQHYNISRFVFLQPPSPPPLPPAGSIDPQASGDSPSVVAVVVPAVAGVIVVCLLLGMLVVWRMRRRQQVVIMATRKMVTEAVLAELGLEGKYRPSSSLMRYVSSVRRTSTLDVPKDHLGNDAKHESGDRFLTEPRALIFGKPKVGVRDGARGEMRTRAPGRPSPWHRRPGSLALLVRRLSDSSCPCCHAFRCHMVPLSPHTYELRGAVLSIEHLV